MISFWQAGIKRGAIIAVFSAALLGCSSPEAQPEQSILKTDSQTDFEVDSKQKTLKAQTSHGIADSRFSTDLNDYSAQAIDFLDFTLEGKPTKSISTPNGYVNIYDPSKDEYIRSRFEMYKNANYPAASPLRKDLLKLNQITKDEYRKNYCSMITDGNCFTQSFNGCEGPQAYACRTLPPGAVLKYSCSLNAHEHNIRDFQTMPDLDDAISKYFEYECQKWAIKEK